MSKYVISFEDNPWYQDECVGYYKCGEIPWWSAKKSDIKKLTPLDKELDEAYKRGLEDGKARNESGCVGCKYEDERIDHAPCIYCCNAYSNEWMEKEKPDEIKVGDWVFNKHVGRTSSAKVTCVDGQKVYILCDDGSCGFADITDLEKTNVPNPKIEKLLEMLRGEQRDCHTCKHQVASSIECVDCRGFGKWEPKGGAE